MTYSRSEQEIAFEMAWFKGYDAIRTIGTLVQIRSASGEWKTGKVVSSASFKIGIELLDRSQFIYAELSQYTPGLLRVFKPSCVLHERHQEAK